MIDGKVQIITHNSCCQITEWDVSVDFAVTVDGLTPEQAVAIKGIIEGAYKKGRHQAFREVQENIAKLQHGSL